jgi:hypothetical protein
MTIVTTRTATPATTGGWIALSGGSRVLAVSASVDESLVAALWSAIDKPDGLQLALDHLTSTGLSATPHFALLDWSGAAGSLRVIARGAVTVTVTHAGSDDTVDGVGVSTWIERSFSSVAAAALVVSTAAAAPVAPLPIALGAAWVQALTVDGFSSDEPAVAPGAAEAARAVPQPVPESIDDVAPVTSPVDEAVDIDVDTDTDTDIDIEATVTDAPTDDDDTAAEPEGLDYLFADTMYRPVGDAAERAKPPLPDAATAPAEGDHDGHTVLTSDIAKLRGRRTTATPYALTPAVLPAPAVSLVLADGTREPLRQPILVGRSPSVSQVSGGKMPRMITVGGVDQDISRTHVRFSLEGGTVVVTDLHSRNGTTVAMPGKEPQKLRAGEPTSVIVGSVVDLGGGVTFTVDED